MKRALVLTGCLSALALASCTVRPATDDTVDPGSQKIPPVLGIDSEARVPDQYIIVFSEETSAEQLKSAAEQIRQAGGEIIHRYETAIKGFNVRVSKEGLERLRSIEGIKYIETDNVGRYQVVQTNPPDGLDRVSERLLPLDNRYTYNLGATGVGVNAYVIDSGMRITHTDFGGRASNAFTVAGVDFSDCADHGTHVAGIIGGTEFGIAKNVNLHNVRVGSAGGCVPTDGNQIAGVDWVAANRILPAVANMSIWGSGSPAVDGAVAGAVNQGVTFVVIAGNDFGVDACTKSPAREPTAITVGSTDPASDQRSGFSNIGPCIDMFAPGDDIVSATDASDTSSGPKSGTSMAAPHVAGVAARVLEVDPTLNPVGVQNAITFANNTAATPGWPGISSLGAGSPNELLHYGSRNNGFDDGDPHITTVNGIRYDFQSAGEFVVLRDNAIEIQARQKPVPTQVPIQNAHNGLRVCVSVNTAIAARVGRQRVTYQPSQSGANSMEIRVDGGLVSPGPTPITLSGGGYVKEITNGDGIEVGFPDGSSMIATSRFWTSQNTPYVNLSVYNTMAKDGIMGEITGSTWLPRLSNGSIVGPKPSDPDQRYKVLYDDFAGSWRVSAGTSLFDYGPGQSTTDFTVMNWPPQGPSCEIPGTPPPAASISQTEAEQACQPIQDTGRRENCIADVAATGEKEFVRAYLLSERLDQGATRTLVTVDRQALSAFVRPVKPQAENMISGAVQFFINGERYGRPIRLDKNGNARIKLEMNARKLEWVSAKFNPRRGSQFLESESQQVSVNRRKEKVRWE